MKMMTCLFLLLFSSPSWSQDLSEMMASMDKASVMKMIEFLEKSGKINKDEAAKAKADLAKMSDSDFKGLKEKGKESIKKNDAAGKEGTSFANENAAVGIKLLEEE